ncbi:forkhead box [Dermatophagoides pteronyssinus]|uniref:Forkhead box n=1 Tax=Dermatophagoides pteronyssinus TaxID=6956 RepID=A0ABQ8IXW0_DERPT|nr:forkhead box [Dermatophagoides pteronyssinus]
MAIESSPTRSMMVRDIYKWIINRYPFFLTAPSGWKNTIRHTLSLRKCFKKINNNHGKNNDSDLKSGGYWYVDPEYRSILLQQAQRIAKNSSSSSSLSNQQLPSTKSILKGKDLKRKNKPIDPIVIDSKNKPNQQLPSITNNNHYKQYYLRRENNNYYHPIKMNSNYFVYNNNNNNPNSIRIDNIISKGNIYRNLISIISFSF